LAEETLTPQKVQKFISQWKVYRDDVSDPCFNSLEQIEKMQNELLRRQISRLAKDSRFYRTIFHEYGTDPASIKTVADLEKLPLTHKSDYMANPESFRLTPKESRIENNLWEVNYTTGTTTGKPSPFYITVHDMYANYLAGLRMYKVCMLAPDGININLYPFGPLPHIGYTRMFTRTAAIGRPWVSPTIGMKYEEIPVHRSMEYALDLIESWNVKPLLLGGIPSFIRRLIIKAEQQRRNFSKVSDIHIGGEPFNQNVRDDLRARLAGMGAQNVRITNVYGFTEMQTSVAECCEYSGCHVSSPDQHYFEIVDEKGRRLPDGEVGFLAITHLNSRGTALARFINGDMMKITHQKCPFCGRNGIRFMPLEGNVYATRSSELIKVKGTLINPNVLKSEILGIKGIEEYQIIVDLKDPEDPLSGDELIIKIYTEGNREDLKRTVTEVCRNSVEMTPKVEYVPNISMIYDINKSLKSVRLIDRRPK